MKYLFLIILSSFSLLVFSQQWPVTNSQWVYCKKASSLDNSNPNNNYGALEVNYVSDTLINGITYNISSPNTTGPFTTENGSYFTRFSNDTIYRWVNSNEFIFFTFNLKLNDVYTTYRSIGGSSDTSCTSLLTLKVIDSTSTIINQATVTKWTLQDTIGAQVYNTGSVHYDQFIVYEKYGFANFPWLSPSGEDVNCTHSADYPYTIFNGYSDINTPVFGGYCPVVGIDNKTEDEISMFPNPIQNELNIITNPDFVSKIIIYDVNGKIILSKLIEQKTTFINTTHLDKGMYFYQVLNSKNEIISLGKFIKN